MVVVAVDIVGVVDGGCVGVVNGDVAALGGLGGPVTRAVGSVTRAVGSVSVWAVGSAGFVVA